MKKQAIFFILIFSLLFTVSCKKDFEEINKKPDGFSTASDGSLFNYTISSLQTGWNEQLYVNNEVIYKATELASVPFIRWGNYSIGTEDIWKNYYKALPYLRELEKRFAEKDSSPALTNMKAMEKIILAYKTFKVTDLFGDIPFTNAGYGYQDISKLHPEFDSQESIYKFLLNELKWAAENIDPAATIEEPLLTFSNFDKLFFGDLTKWQKFANSLRLRYAMRMVNKEPVLAGDIIKDIIENHKPTFGVTEFGQLNSDPLNETAALWPHNLLYRNESKGWSFNQAKDVRMGSTIWHHMSVNDSADGSGIFDPRVYYFFDTNNNDKWIAYPNSPVTSLPPDGGIPYDYTRDLYYHIKGANCLYSPVNYYLARDMDYIPDILMTGAEVIFLRAEAYMRGIGVSQDVAMAGTEILDGTQSSIDFWTFVMSNSKLPYGASFSANITVPANLNFLSVQNHIDYYSGGVQQLKEIYAQSCIDFFWQPQQVFALARRTGMTPREGSALNIYRFTIPPSEVSYNQLNWLSNIGSAGDNLNQKVWWMN